MLPKWDISPGFFTELLSTGLMSPRQYLCIDTELYRRGDIRPLNRSPVKQILDLCPTCQGHNSSIILECWTYVAHDRDINPANILAGFMSTYRLIPWSNIPPGLLNSKYTQELCPTFRWTYVHWIYIFTPRHILHLYSDTYKMDIFLGSCSFVTWSHIAVDIICCINQVKQLEKTL